MVEFIDFIYRFERLNVFEQYNKQVYRKILGVLERFSIMVDELKEIEVNLRNLKEVRLCKKEGDC